MKQNTYNIIILAAGASTRLGRPKQLLSYNNSTLICHAIDEATLSGIGNVYVVLGAGAERIGEEINHPKVKKLKNHNWEQGISSSITTGVGAVESSIDGLILMVCDQPYVDASLLRSLITTYERTGKPVVACHYQDTVGTPVFFHRSLFEKLMKLHGDAGAKNIIINEPEKVELVPFFRGEFDIDNNEDYEALITNSSPGVDLNREA